MSKIIYKQRCNPPGKPNTPMLNRKHLRYIATRPGAIRNESQAYGLFGKLSGMEQQGDIDLEIAVKEVSDKSKQKTNMYRAILSMREEDALPLGCVCSVSGIR